jgi:hypothetical protein
MRSILLSGLLSEPVNSLREQIRAWDDADIGLQAASVAVRGAKRILSDDAINLIDRSISGAKAVLGGMSDGTELILSDTDYSLMKLCRLCAHFGEAISSAPTTAQLEFVSLRVEQKFIEMLNLADERSAAERIRRVPRRGYSGSSVVDGSRYVLTQVFDQLGSSYDKLPESDKRKIAESVLKQIETLDPTTQAAIRENLDIDRLGAEALVKSGALSSLGVGIGAAVAIGGFGSYTLLTSTMASVAGLVGVTLPFKAYILAASGLAFLSNPIVIGIAAVGGGVWMRRRVNRDIHDKHAAVQVALSIVARSGQSTSPDLARTFTENARERYQEYRRATGSARKLYTTAFPAFEGP